MSSDIKTKNIVEKIGVYLEKSKGFTPVSARIIGYLVISEPPYRTFDEIRDYLSVSKSATSNGINLLISKELIDYMTLSGDRKRYFKLNTDAWLIALKQRIGYVAQLKILIQEILNQRSNKYPEFNNSLENILLFFEMFEKEIPTLITKWENSKK